MKPLVLFVLGGPGAAKGTQCTRIVEKYGYTHLSAGELLRDERKNPDSQYGELIEKYIKEGKIVPVEITISLLKREMDQTMAANAQKNKFLIDGFPRNQDKPWMGKQMYLLFCFLTIIMRSVLNNVLKGEKVVVGLTTTERAWKREFRLILNL